MEERKKLYPSFLNPFLIRPSRPLPEEMAVEVDFARKFYEGISQALHYAMLTGKNAALLLIVEKERDWKYVKRAKRLIEFYRLPVTVFVVEGK